MPRHRIDFLFDQEAFFVIFGWDGALGFWAEFRAPGWHKPLAEFGALHAGYNPGAPLQGLLTWLVGVGALDALGLDEALIAWASPVPVRLSKRGRVALDVIETLKREAD